MIMFKTDRIKTEYTELTKRNPKLTQILGFLEGFVRTNFKKEIIITCIFRSQEENTLLYRGQTEPKWRPHTTWNAVDLRSSLYTEEEIKKIVEFANKNKVLGGLHRCASYHKISGNVYHLHIQA